MFDHIINISGAIYKGRPHPGGGRGASQKRTHADTGAGGSVVKSRHPQIQNFTEISDFSMLKLCTACYKTLKSTTIFLQFLQ